MINNQEKYSYLVTDYSIDTNIHSHSLGSTEKRNLLNYQSKKVPTR